MATKTIIEAVNDALREEMRRDDRVIVMGEDVGVKGGVFKATAGLYKEFGENRVLDTPLAESSIVGVAIGAAINGMRPVAEIQFADFIHPAMNQIINEAARLSYRSQGTFKAPMVIRAPYGGGIHGGLYHSQCVEAFFSHVPGLKVITPSTPYETKGLLKAAIRDDNPVLFFEHKKTYRMLKEDVPDDDYVVPIGKARVRREGSDLSVFSYGLTLVYALEAAETLADEGLEVEVVDLRTLRPLDEETVLESAKKTGKCLVVYEDNRFCGYGAEVAALIAEQAFEYLDGPVMRLGGAEIPAVPYAHTLEEWFMPSPEKIATAMRRLAEY